MTDRCGDATAVRRALEVRLKQQAADTGIYLARQRRLIVFDRVTARLSADPTAVRALKGAGQ